MKNIKVSFVIILLVIYGAGWAEDCSNKLKEDGNQLNRIDLAKEPYYSEKRQKWLGKKVNEIIDKENIKEIILTQANTNPTAVIDIENILDHFRKTTNFINGPQGQALEGNMTWEAVIITKDQKYYLFRRFGSGWACLTGEDNYGFFKVER